MTPRNNRRVDRSAEVSHDGGHPHGRPRGDNPDHSTPAPHAVEPLGVFGVLAGRLSFEQLRDELRALAESIPKNERAAIAAYLLGGSVVFAIMEHTKDVLNGSFGVPGGSALLTDGVYYWRRDAAEYVERHGIALPDDFLRRGRALRWLPRQMTSSDVLDVYEYLEEHVRRVGEDSA